MSNMIRSFKNLTPEERPLAGGKGAMLSKMYQDEYPVPEGFVVLPSAFHENKLRDEAWSEIQSLLKQIRDKNAGCLFAVRSSALSEDSAAASFAGEFETVLNRNTDEEIKEAIYKVFQSKESYRVKAYTSVQGMDQSHQIAVVIMLMVPSEISGVLFTADPITGSHESMSGNYVYGLGEQLVSGESNAYPFKLFRPKGKYEGPKDFKKYSSKLFRYASRLVKDMRCQQDIEWAVSKGRLYILQARPITTLKAYNLDTYEMNASLDGDYLWTNTNVGEAMSDVFTPLSWSVIRTLDEEQSIIPNYYLFSGNICGRMYSNVNVALSMYKAFGRDYKPVLKKMNYIFGKTTKNMDIPVYPFSGLQLLKVMLPRIGHMLKCSRKISRSIPLYIKDTPAWCRNMKKRIEQVNDGNELLELWKEELWPYNCKILLAGRYAPRKKIMALFKLNEKLPELLGKEAADALLSSLGGNSSLESLGPVVGISKIIKGEMTKEEYMLKYGHRSPHEFELSIPDPSEDKMWLEKQIEENKRTGVDAESLLKNQEKQYILEMKRLKKNFPSKYAQIKKQIEEAYEGSYIREALRSEWTRVFRVNRTFALKAGQMTGIGNDVFFLYIHEILDLLTGDRSALEHIPARQKNYDSYRALPALPSIIRGRIDPYKWAKNPDRRVDYYDFTSPADTMSSNFETLKGFPGAAGKIEGPVRILKDPEDSGLFQPGEILVASTTNLGWTPIFPKAEAIITDIGAPLSHAAIVARELGIPAVVGCGSATSKLKTGDKVLVDGSRGEIQILDK